MQFIKVENYEQLSEKAAQIIADVVINKPDCVLGLATGSSPIGTYKNLVKWNKEGKLDFSKVMSINLDEYEGLDGEHDQSYRYFMNDNLFNHINIDKANTFVPNGKADDIDAECKTYDQRIADHGIDIQLLGIGLDGHIGFNEPDEFFTKETHKVVLDESTIVANARFFESIDDVPKTAITMGMGGIMSAKKVLLIANGQSKKDIIEKAFFGPITPKVPASILQLHNDVTVIFSEK
ncbi:MAG: glucosamine-6-phosphate deaminase [Ruminococcaceae bacterium]|nr:glucosamine-6-phosphate deaminase [Oscillospiraceae bacterium]